MREGEIFKIQQAELRNELPKEVSRMLEIAFQQYPELAKTKIEAFPPQDRFDAGGFYEFEEGADGQPIAKICVSRGNAELLRPLLEIRKSSVAINAKMLGIDPKDVTPQLLQYFIIAHELGHIKDFKVNYEGDPSLEGWEAVDEMAYQRDAVLAMLPVPNLSPTHLARELEGLTYEDAIEKFSTLKEYKDFASIEDILARQESEYRSSAPESYADEFAAIFLKTNADQLGLDQLSSGHAVAA